MKEEIVQLCEKLHLAYEFTETEHSGCFGKSCEGDHWVKELRIWQPRHPRWVQSFDNPGGWCIPRIIEFSKEEPLLKGKLKN